MIFNSSKVLDLLKSRNGGNTSRIDSLIHEETRSLIESIAALLCTKSPGQLDFSDLVQEGHLKLHYLIVSESFKPGRGTIYSFLSFVLRNAMIDFIRKSTKEVSLGDIPQYDTTLHAIKQDRPKYTMQSYSDDIPTDVLMGLSDHMLYRFPSVSDYLSLLDAANYIARALYESVHNKSRGIRKTLSIMYGFSSNLSKIMYRSSIIYMKLYVTNDVRFPDAPRKFLCMNPSYELSNVPDMALLVGHDDVNSILWIYDNMKIVL